MKLYKSKKVLKNSRQVAEFAEGKPKKFMISYKGGIGVVEDGRVSRIYVRPGALKQAKQLK